MKLRPSFLLVPAASVPMLALLALAPVACSSSSPPPATFTGNDGGSSSGGSSSGGSSSGGSSSSGSSSGGASSSGSSSGGASSGGSSSGGSSSSGSSSGGSSSSSSSGGGGNGYLAYCIPAGVTPVAQCFAFAAPDGGKVDAAAVCAADTADHISWSSVPSCTFPGLLGCCDAFGATQCFYGGSATTLQQTCTDNGGTWSATSP